MDFVDIYIYIFCWLRNCEFLVTSLLHMECDPGLGYCSGGCQIIVLVDSGVLPPFYEICS